MSATELAREALAALVRAGAQEVVLCPGSRNAPLLFEALRLERGGAIRLHTRIDERTAGFLALGLAKASHRPVAVVVTSGTAVANLHPAVLEASHAGERLVVLSADRPAVMRRTGANQTTDQAGLFGDAAPCLDVAGQGADLDGFLAVEGPVQLNLQFSEPLVPSEWTRVAAGRATTHGSAGRGPRLAGPADAVRGAATHGSGGHNARLGDIRTLGIGPRTVVVAGDDAGPPARVLAQEGDWPLLAEPSSGSRTGTHPIATYRLLLGTRLADEIQRVVVYGHPTLSRPVTRLLARPDVEVVSVPPAKGRWPARPHPVTWEAPALRVERADDPAWRARWMAADRRLLSEIHGPNSRLEAPELAARGGTSRGSAISGLEVARAVSAAVPPRGQLFVGASNPIRDLDLMAVAHPVGERRKVLANRGLAGIDGTVSSAIGMALTRPGARNLALMGDVTFLHEAGALVIGPEEPRPDLTVVVANDDGGSIFAGLEQGAPAYADAYERLFGTPHHVDLAALCAATRTPHWRVDSLADLEHALASPSGGIEVVEVPLDRFDRRSLDARLQELADTAVDG